LNVGRFWRTARHLSKEQIAWRAWRRGRHEWMARFPQSTWRKIVAHAEKLGRPDLRAASLARVATHVKLLNAGLEADIAKGRFNLLGREFEFGSPEGIDWRGDFAEGDNPLRRMTLSYLGHIFTTGDVSLVERMVASLEEGNPFSAPGVFRDTWNPYAASHRVINLMAWMALNKRPDPRLITHARLCAAVVLSDLERDLGYNHLLKNIVALAAFGLQVRPKLVSRSVAECVMPDGGHAERSPMYHVLGLLDLRILREMGYDVADALARMEAALPAITHPDGDIALFNDSWVGGAPRAADVVAPTHETTHLEYMGYTKLAGGGDVVIFDCGRPGPDGNPAHAHSDFLSLELSVASKRIIVDPGVPTYTAGPERKESRSAAAHNGPFAGEPMELWGSFRVGRRAAARPIHDAAFEGVAPLYCAGVLPQTLVARWVGLWPGQGMLVCDRGRRSRFLLARDIPAEALRGTLARAPDRYWPRYGSEEAATALTVTAESGCAATFFRWGAKPTLPALDRIFGALGNVG
jgi:hypothetical protein